MFRVLLPRWIVPLHGGLLVRQANRNQSLLLHTKRVAISAATPNSLVLSSPLKMPFVKLMKKTGHFKRARKSKPTPSTVPSAVYLLLSSVLTTATPCLSRSTAHLYVNDIKLQAVINAEGSDRHVSQSVVDCNHWKVLPCGSRIIMATTHYQNVSYESVELPIVSNICGEIFFAHDFLGLLKKVKVPFGEHDTLLMRGLDACQSSVLSVVCPSFT